MVDILQTFSLDVRRLQDVRLLLGCVIDILQEGGGVTAAMLTTIHCVSLVKDTDADANLWHAGLTCQVKRSQTRRRVYVEKPH